MKIMLLTDVLPVQRRGKFSRRNPVIINKIVAHHSGVFPPYGRAVSLAVEMDLIHSFALYHVNIHGWPGIGYHYVVGTTGQIYKCNFISSYTYHAKGGNLHSIGIMLMGNFERMAPFQEQLDSFYTLCQKIHRVMPKVKTVVGHRNIGGSSTVCPGEHLTNKMLAGIL